jgi:hypothetical protein
VVPRSANFADPEFEPTDEELVLLAGEAFAEVRRQRAELDAKWRAHVAELRAASLKNLAEMRQRLASAAADGPE